GHASQLLRTEMIVMSTTAFPRGSARSVARRARNGRTSAGATSDASEYGRGARRRQAARPPSSSRCRRRAAAAAHLGASAPDIGSPLPPATSRHRSQGPAVHVAQRAPAGGWVRKPETAETLPGQRNSSPRFFATANANAKTRRVSGSLAERSAAKTPPTGGTLTSGYCAWPALR